MEVDKKMLIEMLSETNHSVSNNGDVQDENNLNDENYLEFNDEDVERDDEDDEDYEGEDDGSQSSDNDAAPDQQTTAKNTAEATEDKRKRQRCTVCEQTYSKRKYLQKHMLREHNIELPKVKRGRGALVLEPTDDNPRPYKCDQCINEYTQLRHLSRHKRMHARTFCDFCKKSFKFYEEHMRKEHNMELPRPFECEVCGRSFRVKSTFQAHMKIHYEENRVFRCTLCPKAFFQATNLRKHIKSHSNVRSLICDVCGDAFKSSETLKCHMRRHTGDRPYSCQICPRKFTTSNSLMIHQRTHTNEKPYACEVCQKRFSDWSTLLVHKRLHSGESPYVCHICGRRTKQASNLRSHYTHLHKMNDISGRQVRMNAKIFERFTQQEIDQHLLANGDLIALLTKGQEDYNREQNEKSKVTEKLIETMRTPLRPLKKEAKDEEVKPTLQVESLVSAESPGSIEPILQTVPPIVIKIRKTERTVKNESDSNTDISAELELSPIFPETELSMDVFDIHISGDLNSMNVDEKPIGTIDSSDQIESVFLIEDADSGVEPSAPPDVKREYEEDQQDLWMNGGFVNAMDTVFETMKPEPPTSIEPKEQIEKKPRKSSKSIKSSKSPKSPKSTKTKTPKTTKKEKRKKDEVNPLSRMPCSICQKRVQRGNWNVHMVDEHSLIDRPFECYICHKPFKKYHQVKYHLRTHYNDERNVVCHLCGDKFVLNAELNKHIFNRHNDIRPFKCDHIQCSKSFKNRNALKVHSRSHTGEKAFKCSVCLESFSANSSLRLHYRRHTNEKPYACSYCDKRFSDCSTLRQHERIHTGEKPYVCHICGRRTTQASNLKSHYRHYHKLVVKNVKMESIERKLHAYPET